VIDPFRKYVEGWVDDSHGRVRSDVVQDKLEALGLGYAGSERTIRRAVAEAKAAYRVGHRRRFRPWLPAARAELLGSGDMGLRLTRVPEMPGSPEPVHVNRWLAHAISRRTERHYFEENRAAYAGGG